MVLGSMVSEELELDENDFLTDDDRIDYDSLQCRVDDFCKACNIDYISARIRSLSFDDGPVEYVESKRPAIDEFYDELLVPHLVYDCIVLGEQIQREQGVCSPPIETFISLHQYRTDEQFPSVVKYLRLGYEYEQQRINEDKYQKLKEKRRTLPPPMPTRKKSGNR